MKTTKKLVILCMVLLMGVVAVMPSTFSWYGHNDSQAGDRMSYVRENLPVSAGAVSVETKEYKMKADKLTDDGQASLITASDYNEVYYDEKGNKIFKSGTVGSSSVSVDANKTKYFGTTFTNSSSSPAYVNLYLKNFKNKKTFFVGTTAPSLTHKGISSTVHLASNNQIRVYFQFMLANNWNASGAKKYVVYKDKSGTVGHTEITETIDHDANGAFGSNASDTYWVDLAKDTTEFFFATDGNNSGFNTEDNSTTMDWYRTNTITDIQPEKGYYLSGYADDTTWHAECFSFDAPGGLSTMKTFDKVNINANQHAYINLSKGINYTGKSVEYSVNNNNYLTLNSATGMISAKSTAMPPSAQVDITTTITSAFGDTRVITTRVTNPNKIAAIPVSTNIKIPPRTTTTDANGNPVTTDGKALVVWYISNKDPSEGCSFDSIYYSR